MKKTTKAFIEECKEKQLLNKIVKRNTIDFNNYFKYSGEIELSIPLYNFESCKGNMWIYNENERCRSLHSKINSKK